jgi:hypothetical protein
MIIKTKIENSFFFRNVVVTQPGRNVWEFEHPWSNTLCSCFNNMKQCNHFINFIQ